MASDVRQEQQVAVESTRVNPRLGGPGIRLQVLVDVGGVAATEAHCHRRLCDRIPLSGAE